MQRDVESSTATPPPPLPPSPPPSPPSPRRPRGPDYCWSAQLSQLPLADPTTDGERVYATDNRGVVIAVDVRTGEAAWRSAACALDAFWPSSPLVAGGAVYLVCATSAMVAINATTGRLMWRSGRLCVNGMARECSGFGSYGHPAYSAELGLVYLGAPDRSYYALNAVTGEVVWNHYEGPTYLAFGSSVGLLGGALYAVSRTLSDNGNMKLLALDAANGSVVWSREFDQTLRDNGRLQFVNDTLAVGTSGGQLRLFSVGPEGGDLLWSLAVTNSFIFGVERAGDTLYFGDAAGWVRAVSIPTTALLWAVDTMELPELEGVPVPLNTVQPRPVYSNGRLYVTCVAGLLVLDAANGKVLWTDLSQRSLASPLVIERPEGAQVVWGQYLDRVVSVGPACRPSGRGQGTLAFTNTPPPPPPPASPPPASAAQSPPLQLFSPRPTPSPSPSPAATGGGGGDNGTAAPTPSNSSSPLPAAACPVCPTISRANCSTAPTAAATPAAAVAARVSLLLSGVSATALKGDARAQDALAAAVRQVAAAAAGRSHGSSSSGGSSTGPSLRVEYESVSSSGRSSVVVRLRLEAVAARGGGSSSSGSSSSSSSSSAARRVVSDALSALQDSIADIGYTRLQAAVGAAAFMHAPLSGVTVRALVAVLR
ncbi:hypothetical protein HXX76_013953 [Chlamydomonas incerta]|uniref:Pyrrolo-quinoline quinone repeat domain-containing protein n=1 Tax=Chlamydomonas incerta TaxID=51695 RepID=A0A835VRK8_CHLIN|nr:hypothetical protein HXX76_013953 [Chlamydomonas incerta]|eukprot:KAG2425200.1 hypothetical protein HXX76_013953 [Chlamydomonas incerta]